MKISKQKILKALEKVKYPNSDKNILEKKCILNIQVFDKEICIDLTLETPAFHVKKKVETDIIAIVHQEISDKISVQLNIKINAPVTSSNNKIKGKENINLPPNANKIAKSSEPKKINILNALESFLDDALAISLNNK